MAINIDPTIWPYPLDDSSLAAAVVRGTLVIPSEHCRPRDSRTETFPVTFRATILSHFHAINDQFEFVAEEIGGSTAHQHTREEYFEIFHD